MDAFNRRKRVKQNEILVIISGPMYSGKTGELIRVKGIYSGPNHKEVICVTSYKDTRYGAPNSLITHAGVRTDAIPCVKLRDIWDEISKADVVLIDEAQFIENLREDVLELVNISRKIVYVSILSATSEKKMWPNLIELQPYADDIHFFHSICYDCGNPASFSHCTGNKQTDVLIGGKGLYIPLCRGCDNIRNIISTNSISS
jgi:thymidine kinase